MGILNNKPLTFRKHFPITKTCSLNNKIVTNLPTLLGDNTYIVLLQNHAELRPSGGFMGSYATLNFKNNVLSSWNIEDIHIPDGQLQGHVEPPVPIQQAFGNGYWSLRDSNWDIDFSEAAKDINWFFEKGGVTGQVAIIAINSRIITDMLDIIGEVKPQDTGQIISSDNFLDAIQSQIQDNFSEGSHAKKFLLTGTGKSLEQSVREASAAKQLKIVKAIYQNYQNGEILGWSESSEINNIFKNINIDGELNSFKDNYLYIVDTNLASNKSNCCIERSVNHHIGLPTPDNWQSVKITYKNNSPPPQTEGNRWAGDYINYLRVVVPQSAQTFTAAVNGEELNFTSEHDREINAHKDKSYTTTSKGDYKIVGFWVIVKAGSSSEVNLEYSLAHQGQELIIQKQPGMNPYRYNMYYNDKLAVSKKIEKNTVILTLKAVTHLFQDRKFNKYTSVFN
jgi:hypothetical protein